MDPTKIAVIQTFKPSSLSPLKKKYPSTPSNHSQVKDISKNLSAAELVRVQAGPNLIDFGRLFVKSKTVRVFTVRNDLSLTIKVLFLFFRLSPPTSLLLLLFLLSFFFEIFFSFAKTVLNKHFLSGTIA